MDFLRLITTWDCPRSCEGCCNKQYDRSGVPVWDGTMPKVAVLFTGGEPLLYPTRLIKLSHRMRAHFPKVKQMVYTANVRNLLAAFAALQAMDGLTLTLHEQSDVDAAMPFMDALASCHECNVKSLHLNVFPGIRFWGLPVRGWQIKHKQWLTKNSSEWLVNRSQHGEKLYQYLEEHKEIGL